jgi:hypothetical protein
MPSWGFPYLPDDRGMNAVFHASLWGACTPGTDLWLRHGNKTARVLELGYLGDGGRVEVVGVAPTADLRPPTDR